MERPTQAPRLSPAIRLVTSVITPDASGEGAMYWMCLTLGLPQLRELLAWFREARQLAAKYGTTFWRLSLWDMRPAVWTHEGLLASPELPAADKAYLEQIDPDDTWHLVEGPLPELGNVVRDMTIEIGAESAFWQGHLTEDDLAQTESSPLRVTDIERYIEQLELTA